VVQSTEVGTDAVISSSAYTSTVFFSAALYPKYFALNSLNGISANSLTSKKKVELPESYNAF